MKKLFTAIALSLLASNAWAQDGMPIGTVTFFTGACPTGWETASEDAEGRYMVGVQLGRSPGLFFGTQADEDPVAHTHTAAGSFVLPAKEFALIGGDDNGDPGAAGLIRTEGESEAGTAGILPTVSYNLCRKTAARQAGLDVPTGVITGSLLNCPALVSSEYVRAEGRFTFGYPGGSKPSGSYLGGKPLTFGEKTRTHQHTVAGIFDLPELELAALSGCCAKGYAPSGKFGYNTKTSILGQDGQEIGGFDAPYYLLRYCQAR